MTSAPATHPSPSNSGLIDIDDCSAALPAAAVAASEEHGLFAVAASQTAPESEPPSIVSANRAPAQGGKDGVSLNVVRQSGHHGGTEELE